MKADRFRQVAAILKIGYTELQYWLVGMTPEGYHFQQSRNYEQLGASKRSAHHSHQVLRYAEYPEPRARLGYYYAMQAKYAEAAEHYRKAAKNWPHPSILLALAQAELRMGNHQAAAELIEQVEASQLNDQLVSLTADVKSELKTANNGMQATCADARA